VVDGFFGCVGSEEVGGGRLHSDEVGSAGELQRAWQGRWSLWLRQVSADSEVFGS
jgi:hypothetical protein